MEILVLASSSQRRIELLRRLGADFIVIPPRITEKIYNDPAKTVLENAFSKASYALEYAPENSVIIGMDTVIFSRELGVIGKPATIDEANHILKLLRGKWHSVYTGAYVIEKNSLRYKSFIEETRVKMRNFSDEELTLYISSLEPLMKAGGYAIQGLGALLIETIVGDYYNVVGIPITRLYITLKKYFGVDLLREAVKKRVLGKTRTI
ncbi:Maf family protein [Staphylothermus hellenicus]|uniref:dTTP/UTP pyrophosphatase n=1 Tax=Staphylothermus hellenicus (strain DSM 12710 / JCM 10830 / BK20S6-10-b1 / P8) TaxID=591019 RepID=D7DAK9_STAHD|nr:Maf family protein [Staphylothermus hellenicus]ADI31206.1 maf protein [Staphylothermus hellenicus DSM 12710]